MAFRRLKYGAAAPTLTGDATVADVAIGKTFYSTDPNTLETGTKVDAANYAPTVSVGTVVADI
jgi:hypothetical protein